MDPNKPKYYSHQFMHPMRYLSEYSTYMSTGYQQMPPQLIPGMPMGTFVKMGNSYMGQPQPQVPCQTMAQQNSLTIKTKVKRRSKDETKGRIYKCTKCERAYLSYPALYVHIKSKHSVQDDAQNDIQDDVKNEVQDGVQNDVKDEVPVTHNRVCRLLKKNLTKEQKIDPRSILYFRTEEHKGGPTAIIYKFKDAYDILFSSAKRYNSFENHKLYIELYKLHTKNVTIYDYSHEHPGCIDFGPTPAGLPPAIYALKSEDSDETQSLNDFDNPNPTLESNSDDKEECDEIFAKYLDSVAKETNKESYLNILKFIFLYRECLNRYVTSAVKKLLRGTEEMISLGDKNLTNDEGKKEHCIMNNVEQVPKVSNKLVVSYLNKLNVDFGTMYPIELIENFCGWLFENSHTYSKPSLI